MLRNNKCSVKYYHVCCIIKRGNPHLWIKGLLGRRQFKEILIFAATNSFNY